MSTNRFFKYAACFSFATWISLASAQQNDVCSRIIDHGMNNIAMRTSSVALADRVYWKFCDESYGNMSDSKKAEFGVTIKAIPFNASGEQFSASQKWARFCGTYKTSTDFTSNESLLTSKMHDRAIDAWRSCITMTQANMFIDYRIPASQRYADIFVKYTGPTGSTNFNGVESTGFVCKSNGQDVNSSTKMIITTAETAIRCERQSVTQDVGGVTSEYFPDGGITVKTDAGNASSEFVAMVEGPGKTRFAQVDTQIAGVRADVGRLSDQLLKWGSEGETRGNAVGGGDPAGTTQCPTGQYMVGFQYWGSGRNTRYCIGCANGFQVICRPLNTK